MMTMTHTTIMVTTEAATIPVIASAPIGLELFPPSCFPGLSPFGIFGDCEGDGEEIDDDCCEEVDIWEADVDDGVMVSLVLSMICSIDSLNLLTLKVPASICVTMLVITLRLFCANIAPFDGRYDTGVIELSFNERV